ncbi:hypothetical protein N474_18840 [Pseudoalteromonas luteoviolacea CPMOR-2]|uniref:hypothetical protein n=1 Tax=Pseudoalteromonas luteoviolacea TaxID=43657 RepID=UPI0007B0ACA4|nr:hypothetical protein [Pseudoalteromonas luteoviolacea]KZN53900.1 hypothetical protein N474_18840 [Pseudoalteromonas luteoviolacea CPMOR-2]
MLLDFWGLKTDTKDVGKLGGLVLKFLEHAKKSKEPYFYPESIVKKMLLSHEFTECNKNTKFIKYDNCYKYYDRERKSFSLTISKTESLNIEIPYKELINFIEKPSASISVPSEIKNYKMEESLLSDTEYNLQEYIKENNGTTDGSILRISSFNKVRENEYACTLEKSSFYYQVRTNLTLDFLLQNHHEKTLRTLDLGRNNKLPSFDNSIMVNSIGVSAIVYYRHPKTGERHFFLKPRKSKRVAGSNTNVGTGVFQGMLGTISGVVQIPNGVAVDNLVNYATLEMLREFSRETGIDQKKEPAKMIKPLCFTRELTRGGKPQFFFLIEIDYISDSDFKRMFRKSLEGIEEFEEGVMKNHILFNSIMSPEVVSNMFYALSYFQEKDNLEAHVLNIKG